MVHLLAFLVKDPIVSTQYYVYVYMYVEKKRCAHRYVVISYKIIIITCICIVYVANLVLSFVQDHNTYITYSYCMRL